MWGGWKRQLLSSDMMSKRLYMIKLISNILNTKAMFGSECFSFKSIVRIDINYGCSALYNIMWKLHPLIVYALVECQITSQKNSIYCPYHVDNIMTYV